VYSFLIIRNLFLLLRVGKFKMSVKGRRSHKRSLVTRILSGRQKKNLMLQLFYIKLARIESKRRN